MSQLPEVMSASFKLEYTFRRSLGPVLSQFFTGLRDRTILGARTAAGRVLVPPSEYDPITGAGITELVPVGDAGEVTSWCWVATPRARHPLQTPFAYALVKLDGADTAMLHAVDAGDPQAMHSGMRVRARWNETRGNGITDIACFEPEPAP